VKGEGGGSACMCVCVCVCVCEVETAAVIAENEPCARRTLKLIKGGDSDYSLWSS